MGEGEGRGRRTCNWYLIAGFVMLVVAFILLRAHMLREPVAQAQPVAQGMKALWVFGYMAAVTESGALAGAAAGFAIGRRGANRFLRVRGWELARRGALDGAFAGWGGVGMSAIVAGTSPWLGILCASVVGAGMALFGVRGRRQVLSSAERAFVSAAECIEKGDRDGATTALREYVGHAKDDPAREARLPAAERWLRGETDTLEVVTELQAAEAPAGTGTELSAAERPEGSGTEMVAGHEPAPDAPAREAVSVREPGPSARQA